MNWFKDHPASVGESYFQHMGSAFKFAGRLFGAGVACLLHGVFPFLFTRTGSTAVKRLHEDMTSTRLRQDGAASAGSSLRIVSSTERVLTLSKADQELQDTAAGSALSRN